jgi:hypothetical protein
VSEPFSLHWLPDSLCDRVAQQLQALLADFCSCWGLPGVSDVRVSIEAHAGVSASAADCPAVPWTDHARGVVSRALFDRPWLADSAILCGVLDRVEKDLQQRMADKFGPAVGASPAVSLPGHAGLLCRFDWLQCSFEQRLSCAQLRASDWLRRPVSSTTLPRVDLERALAGTPVSLIARVGSAVVNVGDLLHLAPGDILLLSESIDEPLRVSAPGSGLNLRALLGSTPGLAGQAGGRHRGFHCLPN